MHFVQAKRLLSKDNGMNIYRGCSHGCIYCDSRSRCYGFTHAFEDIEVKENAPELLEKALRSKRQKCMIGTGAMCDPYLHLEERLLLTRRCLELIDRYEFGVAVQTKSARILRDFDLLTSINEKAKAIVQITLTTYDEDLCKKIEPDVSTTKERINVLMKCKEAAGVSGSGRHYLRLQSLPECLRQSFYQRITAHSEFSASWYFTCSGEAEYSRSCLDVWHLYGGNGQQCLHSFQSFITMENVALE